MEKSVPKSEAIRYGWNLLEDHFGLFLSTYLVAALIQIPVLIFLILTIVFAARSNWALTIVFAILWALAAIPVYNALFIGYVKISLLICSGREAGIKDFLPTVEELSRMILASYFYFTGVFIGLLLCIVPGVLFALKYWNFGWIIIGEGERPLEAFMKAGRLSKGIKSELFVYFLLCNIVLVIGALTCLIGLLLAFPTVLLATTYVHLKLAGMPTAKVSI
jgi:hypothetical protein